MGLFIKKRKTDRSGTLTALVAAYFARRQRTLADYLNRKTAKASRGDLLFGLVVFCSAFGGYLFWLLLETFGIFN